MKKEFIVLFSISILGFTSCTKNSKEIESEEAIVDVEVPASLEEEMDVDAVTCYRYASPKDTIFLTLNRANTEVTGSLSYDYIEKPESKGTFKGEIKGDTIFADYTYAEAGKTLVREMIFVKNDSSLVEGVGLTEVKNGKTMFKPDAILSFNEVMSLEKVECE